MKPVLLHAEKLINLASKASPVLLFIVTHLLGKHATFYSH